MLYLRWFWCVDNICRKANNITAFLSRNLSSCPANIRTKCYTTFVRPQLKYASFVWAPHTQSNTNKLESVQRRAARFVTGNYNATSSVTTMLNHLNWDTLQQHRLRTKAIMMYRIINGEPCQRGGMFFDYQGYTKYTRCHKNGHLKSLTGDNHLSDLTFTQTFHMQYRILEFEDWNIS
jgi:hypothetical protein